MRACAGWRTAIPANTHLTECRGPFQDKGEETVAARPAGDGLGHTWTLAPPPEPPRYLMLRGGAVTEVVERRQDGIAPRRRSHGLARRIMRIGGGNGRPRAGRASHRREGAGSEGAQAWRRPKGPSLRSRRMAEVGGAREAGGARGARGARGAGEAGEAGEGQRDQRGRLSADVTGTRRPSVERRAPAPRAPRREPQAPGPKPHVIWPSANRRPPARCGEG